MSPRPPTKISYKDNWMCNLDSDVAGSSKDTQRIEPKPKTQPSSTGRPVCGQESTKRCVLTPKQVEEDQTGTGRPVLVDQKEEHDIDFRVPGLSHAVVKEAEHLRVQELVKRIENHLHREALHADLQQNNAYNPFSKNSKRIIRELGNVELFELCETVPKVQCSHSLLYWNQGIVYCTCGQCLIDSESRRKFNKLRLDALSFPNCMKKKKDLLMVLDMARPKYKKSTIRLGMRGRDAARKSTLKVNILQVFTIDFSEIQFIVNLAIGWTEQKCNEWEELAKEDHA